MIGDGLIRAVILPHPKCRQEPFAAFDSVSEIIHTGILNAAAAVAQTAFVGGSLFLTTDTELAAGASAANRADSGRVLGKVLVAYRT